MKPSELLDDASELDAACDNDIGRTCRELWPDCASSWCEGCRVRRCLVCGKPGVRYNAKVHPGACRRERRRFLQWELRRRRHRR